MGRTREMTRSPAERATGGKLEFEPNNYFKTPERTGPCGPVFQSRDSRPKGIWLP